MRQKGNIETDEVRIPEDANANAAGKDSQGQKLTERSFIKTHYLIIITLIVYLIQALIFIDRRFVIDEPWSAIPVYQAFDNGGFWVTAINNGAHATIVHQFTNYQLLLLLWHLIMPDELIFSRLLSILFTAGIIVSVYAFAYRIFRDYRWSAVSAAILAVDNVFFVTSYTIRPDVFLGMGIPLLLMLMYDRDFKLKERRLLLAGIAGGILTGFHTNFILAVIAFGIIYIIWESRKIKLSGNLLNTLKFSLGVFAGFLPVLLNIYIYDPPEKNRIDTYVGSYLEKTTTIDENNTILNAGRMLQREVHRYQGFIQFPFRVHMFILCAAALVSGLFSRKKIIKILSALVLLILLAYTLLLANKTMRYFALVLPALCILITYLFYNLIVERKLSRGVRMFLFTILAMVPVSLLAGNIYTLHYFRDSSYSELRKQISFPYRQNDRILGDMLFWDVYRDSNYLSYHSDFDYLKNQKYDYIITGSSSKMKHKRRDYFREEALRGLKTELIKHNYNFYYGDIKIYKVLQ